jgi:hypothetical protein
MMSQFSIDELHEILDLHGKWLRSIDGGKRASLSGAYLSGAVLSGANLSGADLRSAVLRGADLSNAVLSGANLRGADLRSAVLSGANLSGANLRGADLSNAVLSGANLRGADLRSAVLSGANLSGADLRGADLLPDLYLLKFQPVNTKLRAWKFLHRGGTSPYQNHPYEVGKSYSTSDFSTDERGACDKGLNVATLQWCLRNSDAEDNVFIEVEFRAGDIVAVPFATDGKFRVKKLRVVRSISKAKARKIVEEAVSPLGVKQGGKEE